MKKFIKRLILAALVGTLIGGAYVLYLFNMPHRDVQSVTAFIEIEADELVNEFLNDQQAANNRYLAEDGDSKVIIVSGIVASIKRDQKDQKVVVLKSHEAPVGVSATFMQHSNKNLDHIKVGDQIRIKGVIRSGAEYDEDLDFYENVIIEKSDVIKS